jgi:hypothetical protein
MLWLVAHLIWGVLVSSFSTGVLSVFVDLCQCWDDGKGLVPVHGDRGVKGEQWYSCCQS